MALGFKWAMRVELAKVCLSRSLVFRFWGSFEWRYWVGKYPIWKGFSD